MALLVPQESLPQDPINKTFQMKHGYFLKAGSPLKHELTPKIDTILTTLVQNGAMLAGGFVRDYVLNREFQVIEVNQFTVCDTTYITTDYCCLYLLVVIHLYSKKVF